MKAYLIPLLVLSIAVFAYSAQATITSVQLELSGGGLADPLGFDANTDSYSDGSRQNPNVFLDICSDDSAELQDMFVGFFYKVGSVSKQIDIVPAQLVSVNTSNCSRVDLDFSVFKAHYPGIPEVGLDDNPAFPSPTFTPFTETTGFLDGNYTVRYFDAGSGTLNVSVTRAISETAAEITTNKEFIIVAVRNSTGSVFNETLVSLDESILTDQPADFSFNVNGIIIGQTQCQEGETLCNDGTCSTNCGATDDGNAGCIGAANSVCEIGEGCACIDCDGEQDTCASGLTCDFSTEQCVGPPSAGGGGGGISGFGIPFACEFVIDFLRIAPEEPVHFVIDHNCTAVVRADWATISPLTDVGLKLRGDITPENPPPVPAGLVFEYFEFQPRNIAEGDINRIDLRLRLPLTWIAENNIDKENGVKLNRLQNGIWEREPIRYIGDDSGYAYYIASPPGFSIFAITGEKGAPKPPVAVPQPVCGNDVCEAGENFISCPADCLKIAQFIPPYFFLIAAGMLTLLLVLGVGYRIYSTQPPAPKPLAILPVVAPRPPPRLSPKLAAVKREVPDEEKLVQKRLEKVRKRIEKIEQKEAMREFERPKAPTKVKVPKKLKVKPLEYYMRPKHVSLPKTKPEVKVDHKLKDIKKLKSQLSKNLKDVEKSLS